MNNIHYNKTILNYKKNGWVVVKNFFKKKDIENIKNQILNKISNTRKSKNFYYEKIDNYKKLRRIERISDYSAVSKKIIYSNRILKLIKDIKKKEFDLFKDKLNFKYPGGKGYLPHIDGHFFWKDKNNKIQNGWKKYADDFVSLLIPLEKSDKKNGCLYLAQKKNIKNLGNSFNKITKKMSMGTPNIKLRDKKKFNYTAAELEKGDICLFDWKCAHFSKNNNSNKSRMIFYATYYKKNGKSNIRNNYYLDKQSSLNDKKNKSLLFIK
jgi:2-aminoethylphosphonate dioxygenase